MPLDRDRILVPRREPKPVEATRWYRNTKALLAIAVAVVTLVGAGASGLAWLVPKFAPSYKTEFLVDTAPGKGPGPTLKAITDSLRTVVSNAGEQDALAMRRFGGECGHNNNTAQMVGFGTGNKDAIQQAGSRLSASGKATLVKGIVESAADFSRFFSLPAKQVNRIIVITSHGKEACDTQAAAEQEIRMRIAGAGLKIQFRLVGYQIGADEAAALNGLATAVDAPPPAIVNTQEGLTKVLNQVTNVEPVARDVDTIISILNPTVIAANQSIEQISAKRLDAAAMSLDRAKSSIDSTDTQFQDLRGRTSDPGFRRVYDLATTMREQQRSVVQAASDLLAAARAGTRLDSKLAAFSKAADAYNQSVGQMKQLLADLQL